MKSRKLLQKILGGTKNIRFTEMVNLQNVNGQAKPYQIRQFLKLVEKHNLKLEDE